MLYENIEQVPSTMRRFQGVPLQLQVVNQIVEEAQKLDGPLPVTFPQAQARVMENYRLVSGQFVAKTGNED